MDSHEQRRDEFLRLMYREMWNNINRHLTVTWQAVGVVSAAFAVFLGLTEKNSTLVDPAAALMLLVAGWLLSHVYDANTWFNRNLGIIANIEKQFLVQHDASEIHFYFTEPHRRPGTLVSHILVQQVFGIAAAILVLTTHFIIRVIPGFHEPWSHLEPLRILPYAAAILCIIWVARSRSRQRRSLEEFVTRSPGITVREQ